MKKISIIVISLWSLSVFGAARLDDSAPKTLPEVLSGYHRAISQLKDGQEILKAHLGFVIEAHNRSTDNVATLHEGQKKLAEGLNVVSAVVGQHQEKLDAQSSAHQEKLDRQLPVVAAQGDHWLSRRTILDAVLIGCVGYLWVTQQAISCSCR